MKKLFGLQIMMVMLMTSISFTALAQANESLSNLTSPTSVNQSLLPGTDNSKDLGSSTSSWRDGYFDGTGFFKTTLNVGGASTTNGIQLNPNSTGKTLELRFLETTSNGTNYVGFKAPTGIAANKIWILPSADGTSGQVLSTNGSGTLSWASAGGGSSVTANFIPRSDGTNFITGSFYDSGSKIGLGTTSPSVKLHLKETSDGEVMRIEGVDPLLQFYEGGLMGYLRVLDGDIFLSTNSANDNGDLSFGTQSDVHMTINQDGDVSVGTTSSSGKFYISGDGDPAYPQLHLHESTIDQKARLQFTTTTGVVGDQSSWDIAAGTSANNSNDALIIQHTSSSGFGSTVMEVESSGNIGIGTTSPTSKMHINGTDQLLRLSGSSPTMYFQDGSNSEIFLQANGNDMRLGTKSGNTTGKLIFRFNGADKNAMDKNGNLGLGTTSPAAKLHLKGSNEVLRIEGSGAFIQFYNGSVAKSYIFRDGDDLRLGTSTGNTNGKVAIGTANGGDQLFVLKDGSVSIGTSVAKTGYKLSVEGKVVCRELKVETTTWPDYVFADDYPLLPLSDVEASIQQNNHLPGIPSAKELEANGVEVGEMQKLLMQKVEELTLYIIDLQKQVTALKQ